MFSSQLLSEPITFSIEKIRISEICNYIADIVDIPQGWVLNIAFLSDEKIRTLNNQYRQIDSTTDVLSFHYFDDFSILWEDEIAGEIIMSESRIISQAKEHQHSERTEFEILFIHGILHILGYDHEMEDDYETMWKIEKPIREFFKLTN